MIRCPHCGNQNLRSADFCDDCGIRLDSDTASDTVLPLPPSFLRDDIRPHPVRPLSPIGKLFVEEVENKETTQPPARLTLLVKGQLAKEFLLTKPATLIGRWDTGRGIFPEIDLEQADVETKVSRRHAQIIYQDGHYWIEDLGSLNGTVVNRQQRLQQGTPVLLKDGDEIIVGKTFLKFSE